MASGYNDSKGNESFLVVAVIGLALIYFGIKYNYEYVIFIWKYLRIAFLFPFTWIPDWFPFYGKLEISRAFHYLLDMPYTDIVPITARRIDLHFLRWLSWVPGVIVFYWGFKRFLYSGGLTKRYDMDLLTKKFGTLYEELAPYVNDYDPNRAVIFRRNNASTHKFAMSICPRDFGLMNPPLGLERKAKINKSLNAAIWDGKKSFDHDLAMRAFSEQLGNKFSGIENLRDYERKVFNTICSKITVTVNERSIYYKHLVFPILGAKSYKPLPDNQLLSGMRALKKIVEEEVEKKKTEAKNKKVKFDPVKMMQPNNVSDFVERKDLVEIFKLIKAEAIMSSHSYVRCGLMMILIKSRDSGVMAPNQFRWLKAVDRTLWYCLSTIGRRVSFVESGGPFAHLLLELEIGRPVTHPEVSEAVEGLYLALECDVESPE